jgi:hypothetical protein
MVFDPDGAEVDWILGYDPPADKFQAVIEKIIKGEGTYKALNAAYSKNPKDVAVVFELGRKWGERYDAEKSAQMYKDVIALDPEGRMGQTLFEEAKVSYTQAAEFQLGQAALQSRRGKPEPAALLAFIKKYPEGPLVKSAYARLAGVFYGRSAPKAEAAPFFEEYGGRYPKDYAALSAWVRRIIMDKEPLDKGLELTRRLIEMGDGPTRASAYQSQAQLYLLKGDKAKAAEAAELLIKSQEDASKSGRKSLGVPAMMAAPMGGTAGSATYLLSAARIFLDADKTDRALEVFGPELLKKNRDDAAILTGYAQFWSGQTMNLDSALDAATLAAAKDPGSYRPWNLISQVQMKLKHYQEALAAAEKALAAAPAQPPQIKTGIQKTIDQIKAEMEKK